MPATVYKPDFALRDGEVGRMFLLYSYVYSVCFCLAPPPPRLPAVMPATVYKADFAFWAWKGGEDCYCPLSAYY